MMTQLNRQNSHTRTKYVVLIALTALFGISACASFSLEAMRQPHAPRSGTQNSSLAFYIAPDGNDRHAGTKNRPWRTLERARDHIRTIKQDTPTDIIVYLRGGTYYRQDTFELTPQDSGQAGRTVTYRNVPGEVPIISGGQVVTGWQPAENGIWRAPLARDKKLRALFIDNRRAFMAATASKVRAQGGFGRYTIQAGSADWALESGTEFEGLLFNAQDLPPLTNHEDIELEHKHVWTNYIVNVSRIAQDGAQLRVSLQHPFAALALTAGWKPMRPKGPYTIRNAMELLDEPGEFYFDRAAQTLYYMPRPDEDLTTANVVAPVTEGLVTITGTDRTERAENITIVGLTFAHDDYLMDEVGGSRGWASVQGASQTHRYVENGNWHPTHYTSLIVPAGTINIRNAQNIHFIENKFVFLNNAIALNLENDVQHASVTGCVFYDLMGSALNLGHPQHYHMGDDAGLFTPREEGYVANVKISNSLIHDVGRDFTRVEGISAYLVQNIELSHNDISKTPYSGVRMGWWWGNSGLPAPIGARDNVIAHNRVIDTMNLHADGGGLYFLAPQPGSSASHNYVSDGGRSLYPDDGTAGWHFHHNVLDPNPGKKWFFAWTQHVKDIVVDTNYTTTPDLRDDGTNITITNTRLEDEAQYSAEAQAIIDEAGLQPHYAHLHEELAQAKQGSIIILPRVPQG